MTSTRPNVVLDAKYSVSETAKLMGVHRKTIRNLAEAKQLAFGVRKHNMRQKFFWGREILRFWMAEA